MEITKHEFLAAAGNGDLTVIQHYLAQPAIASTVAALERILNNGHSTCESIRTASRTLMAASRGLWFCVGGEWTGIFRHAVGNQQVEVLAWFFSKDFAYACPTTMQIMFPHIARQAVARNEWLVLETLLESWVFREAMLPESRDAVLHDLLFAATSNGHGIHLLLAHEASAVPFE